MNITLDWTTARQAWADDQRASGLGDRTIDSRDALLHTVERIAQVGPLELQKPHLLAVMNRPHARNGGPLSPGTKQVERSYLQTFTRWMLEEGYRGDDPGARLRRVRVPRRKPRPVQIEHIDRMLSAGAYRTTREMIIIGAQTGLRVSEIVRIRAEDIDWTSRTIHTIRKGGVQLVVHMPDDVVEIARSKPATGWWFPSPYANREYPHGGGHILGKSASTRINIVLRRAGITDPRITGHSLRHYYATQLLRGGANLRVVQEALGHASLATTQLYAEVTGEEVAAAVAHLPRIDLRETANRGTQPTRIEAPHTSTRLAA